MTDEVLNSNLPMPYRIWSPEENVYHHSGRTPSMLSLFFRVTATFNTVHDIDYEVYSGKKDREGIGIYQNDIVYNDDLEIYYKIVYSDTSYNGLYALEAFDTEGKPFSFYGGIPLDCIVVGSKYSTPDLWSKFND